MADVNANIGVNIDTSNALAQIKSLQRQLSQFYTSIAKSSETAALAQRDLQRNLINSVNSLGVFSAEMRTIKTTAESFTDSLEKNKFSMREYFRYAGASTKTFGKLFRSEFDTIGKVAEENVKRLQTQYIKLGRDSNGAMKAIAVIPKELNMSDLGTQTQIAAQKQALFNQLVKQGSTNLLNFGKNTQWAGRQLMVGFTIPLSILGNTAARTFMEMETAALKFRKVYGDLFTPTQEREQALADITALGQSFTKYGIAVSATTNLAAEAAAAGFQGLDLQRQVTEATRLQVLGQVDQQKALETTISLQNAFAMSSEDLADAINFLNAVENQTVVSLDDITTAIPKAAPVVKQLGGDVRDLAFFMAAMKEGGINASEGANALKSGLASLINPTDKASEMLAGFGINIKQIVEKNAGNVKQTVIDFALALDNLSDLNRQRAIEQLFGKFQLARLSTLFENVTKSGNQASRVLDLATASTADLAGMAESELGMTADSAMNKFRKSVEDLKFALVPVGQTFLESVTPIIEFLGDILDKFNNLSDGAKRAITVLTVGIGAIGPVALMTFGLLANGIANIIKFAQILRNGYLRLTGQSAVLGEQTQYLTIQQQNAAAVAHSLDQSHATLTQTFNAEAAALRNLITAYTNAASAAQRFAMTNPGMMIPPRGRRYANGVVSVPGPKGAGDIVPAMLSPGEAVIPADMAKKYSGLIDGMISGNIPGFQGGRRGAYWTASKRNSLLDALGLTGDQRARIPLEATSAAYSVSGIMAPRSVNRQTGLGMTQEYLQSPLGRAATMANLEVGLEDLGLSAERMSEVLDDISPQITKAIDNWDGSLQGWQNATRDAMDTIQQSAKITAAEKDVIRKRFAPINPDDYTVGSNLVTEVSRRRATTRNERVDAQRVYGSERQLAKLRSRGFNVGPGFDFAHMPGYERIPASSVRVGAATVAGVSLTAQQQQMLAQEKAAFEAFRKEQDALAAKNAQSAVTATAKAAGTASPSRKTIPIGEDIARGLEVGMANRTDDVARSGQNLANAAVAGARRGPRRATSAGGTVTSGGVIIPTGGAGGGGGGRGPTFLGMPGMPERRPGIRQRLRNVGSKFGSGRYAGAGMAASMGVMAASMAPGPVGDIASKAMPAVFGLQALQMALKLPIPHIKAFAAVMLAGVGIVKLINSARERERQSIEGLADAATLTKDKLSTLGDFFGVVPRNTPFESDVQQITGTTTAQRTQLDQLKGSEGFQKQFAKDIANLRKATTKEAELIFKSLSIALEGKGFATEQIQTIINALREESGKTDVVIDVKSLKLNTKQGQAGLKQTADEIVSQFTTAFAKGFEEDLVLTGGVGPGGQRFSQWVTQMVPTKELKKQSKAAAREISNLITGISGQFANGQISAEQFNQSFDNLQTIINKMNKTNPAAALMLMQNVIGTLPPKLQKVASGIKSVEGNMLILRMQALGMTGAIAGVAEAFRLLENPLGDVSDKIKAQLLIDKTVKDVVARAKTIENAIKDALGGAGDGTGEDSPFKKLIDQLKGQTKEVNNSISAFGKLKKAGIDTARAIELSKDPLIAMVLNSKLTKEQFKQIIGLIKQLDKGLDKASFKDFVNGLRSTNEAKRNFTGLVSQMKAMGLEAEDINGLLDNPDIVQYLTDGMITAGERANRLQELINQITAAKIIDIEFRLKNDPMSLIKETSDKAQEFYANEEAAAILQMQNTKEWQDTVTTIEEANAAIEKGQNEIAGYEKKIADLEYQLKYDPEIGEDRIRSIEAQIAAEQKLIDAEEEKIAKIQDQIELEQEKIDKINEQIDASQKIIDDTQRYLELKFDRPIEALNDENNVLSNTLDLIARQEDKINEKYDAQEEALSKISKINEDISNQKKQQISLADALTQGDISAAAQIAQEMQAAKAQSALEAQQNALGAARQAELGAVNVGGMTRGQIEERQFQISQQIFALEQQRKPFLEAIRAEEDKIYALKLAIEPLEKNIAEYNRQIELHKAQIEKHEFAIKGFENQIEAIEIRREKLNKDIRDHQAAIDKINKEDVEPAKLRLKQAQDTQTALEKSAKAVVDNLPYLGLTRKDWDAIAKSIEAGKLDGDLLAKATAAMKADVAAAVDKWATMPPVKDLTVNISENVQRTINETIYRTVITNYEEGTGGGGGGSSGGGGGGNGGMVMMATGGKVRRKYMAAGGQTLGSDTVPAMLSPGEFVMNRAASARFEPLLNAMNQGGYTGFETQRYRVSNKNTVTPAGTSQISTVVNNNTTPVYNYSLSVNVNGSNEDANSIANTVMARLRQMQNSDIRRQVV